MDRSLFRYIWRHSKRDQIAIFIVVLASLPFYFASLDLPRRIVNEAIQGRAFENGRATATFLGIELSWPKWLGGDGAGWRIFEGFQVGRIELLFGLSGLFLLLVLVNGGFKYAINVSKGALGERMLRRMRFELFSLILRFTPETFRTIKASETATMIKDEVEPIGGFIGDAFVQPVFLGTQAATAMAFIFIQNVWLGLLAGSVVGVQFIIIPRLRRELLRLGRERQIASRQLAGRVAEVVDGIEAIHTHNAATWERAEIGHRLHYLFDLRFRIFKRKFMVKFLNNLLSQVTPFLFYAVGGYLAIKGSLDIGQLVAVIGAYRELPPPLKELIDWDQQRLDVQVKYEQVVQGFSPDRLLSIENDAADAKPIAGPLTVSGLTLKDAHGSLVFEDAAFEVSLPARLAILSGGGPSAGLLARVLAGRETGYHGCVKLGDQDLAHLPRSVVSRHVAYCGAEPVLFPGTLRDNLVYGLRVKPLGDSRQDKALWAIRLAEARRTGNPVDPLDAPWVDVSIAGVADAEALDTALVDLLERLGFKEDLYRFGLSSRLDRDRHRGLAMRIVEARLRLRDALAEAGMADLVEPFDDQLYNKHATVADNLLFGVPTSPEFKGRRLAEQPDVLDELTSDLHEALVHLGESIAETMVEIFRGLPPGHPLFEQFSFLAADELDDFEAILRRRSGKGRAGLTRDDRSRLLALSLDYVEPRHRLGLLDGPLQESIVAARRRLRERLSRRPLPVVEFYDADELCAAAPLRDNLLFGRVDQSVADGPARVGAVLSAVIDGLDLRGDIERLGLDHPVGPAGRLLGAAQRAAADIVRCLIRRPDILVIDGALAVFGDGRGREVLDVLLRITREHGMTLIATRPNDRDADLFEAVVRIESGRVALEKATTLVDNAEMVEGGEPRALESAGGMA
jgi:putative ABC transport system ATP-binding protein